MQGIDKDTDKIKIYKAGYKQGAVVPRTLITANDRIIKYYNTFCFKACASEQIPQVKGFRERFLEIPMVEGYPAKEWSDITREDQERQQTLRNKLLRWRMETRDVSLPEVKLTMKGRLKELWKPLLQVTHGLTVYDTLFKFVTEQKAQRLSSRQESLEGHIVKTVVNIFNEDISEKPKNYIPFKTIWEELVLDLDGKLNDDKPHVMDTSEFFQVTKNKVGYRLREVLGGKSTTKRDEEDKEDRVFKAYEFNMQKLGRVAKKYGYELVTKLSSYPSSEGVQPPETMEKDHQNNGVEVCHTPEEVANLSNLVTAPRTTFQPHPVEEVEKT